MTPIIGTMRQLFSDKFNSIIHFLLGLLTIYCPLIFPIYVIYQLRDISEESAEIDLAEYYIGMVFGIIFVLIQKKMK